MGRNSTSYKLLLFILILTICWPFTKMPRIYGDPNDETRLLLHDDCQNALNFEPAYNSPPWAGDGSANITEVNGNRVLRFVTYKEGGAVLLRWGLLSNPGLSTRIGFDVSFQIIYPGINTSMVLGLADPHSYDDWNESGGFSYANTNWPFDVVLNMTGQIGFQNDRAGWNIPMTNYTIRVIIDPPKGEYWVTTISPLNYPLLSDKANFSDLTLMNYFVIGFDGIGAETVVSNIDVFYFEPFFEIKVPTNNNSGLILVNAGDNIDCNVTIDTDEYLKYNFTLNASDYSQWIKCTFQPQSLKWDQVSKLTIQTSTETPDVSYPINVTATYVSDQRDTVIRWFTFNLTVARALPPIWKQQFFWTTLLAGGIAFAVGILFMREERRLRTTRLIPPTPAKDEYLTCKNPNCGFGEIPLDSEYCPACGKQLDNN